MADASNKTSELEQKIAATEDEIKDLLKKGYKDDELTLHIQKIHEYNEVKDLAQMIIGQLAMVEGVTTKHLYSRYHLSEDD